MDQDGYEHMPILICLTSPIRSCARAVFKEVTGLSVLAQTKKKTSTSGIMPNRDGTGPRGQGHPSKNRSCRVQQKGKRNMQSMGTAGQESPSFSRLMTVLVPLVLPFLKRVLTRIADKEPKQISAVTETKPITGENRKPMIEISPEKAGKKNEIIG